MKYITASEIQSLEREVLSLNEKNEELCRTLETVKDDLMNEIKKKGISSLIVCFNVCSNLKYHYLK